MRTKNELKQHIPNNINAELNAYVAHRREPSPFLEAVLTNDLMGTFQNADIQELLSLPYLLEYVYSYCSSTCYGSRAKVHNWLNPEEKPPNDTAH